MTAGDMTLATGLAQATMRAALVGALAVAVAWPLRHRLQQIPQRAHTLATVALAAVAVPPLALAYAFTALAPRALLLAGAAP